MAIIEIDNLVVNYDRRRVLDGMTASIDGKSAGLLGPNGAGKSTLLKTILGFVKPISGTVRIFGYDVRTHARDIRQIVGYMPESEAFIKGLSAVRLLRYVGELSGLSSGDAMERAHEVLYYVGLGEARYRPVETLSLGNQQRVKLAQALVHGPRLLILDEPTNALDPDGRREMLHVVRDIGKISDSHVVICSHILQDVEFCCDWVTVINRGKVAVSATMEELRRADHDACEVAIEGDRERFLGAVASKGWACTESRRGIEIKLPFGEGSRPLFALAKEVGVQLRHFHHKQDTLEEIFVNALEESERGLAHAGL